MIVTLPQFLLNKLSVRIFNRLYRWRPGAKYAGKVHYDPFFYPLDSIAEWNRLYGSRGFFQHQCLIPPNMAREGVLALLKAIERSGQGSFLAVLKKHGEEHSPGLMSFCAPGLSLALDFANRGDKTKELLTELDRIVLDHGGRLYPAKDGRMSAETFRIAFPQWEKIEQLRDPALMSEFWLRILKDDGLEATDKTATPRTDT
jgi:L-gulonolactone oxidase